MDLYPHSYVLCVLWFNVNKLHCVVYDSMV